MVSLSTACSKRIKKFFKQIIIKRVWKERRKLGVRHQQNLGTVPYPSGEFG